MGAKAVRGKSDRSFRAWNVSPQDRSSVDEFVSYAQKAMRLSDWSIRVDWSSPCEKGALATTQDMPDSKHAVLKFSEKFLQLSPRERRQVICHELMHCHVFPVQRLAEETVASLVSKQATAVFSIAFTSAVELLVDTLADVLVETISTKSDTRRMLNL